MWAHHIFLKKLECKWLMPGAPFLKNADSASLIFPESLARSDPWKFGGAWLRPVPYQKSVPKINFGNHVVVSWCCCSDCSWSKAIGTLGCEDGFQCPPVKAETKALPATSSFCLALKLTVIGRWVPFRIPSVQGWAVKECNLFHKKVAKKSCCSIDIVIIPKQPGKIGFCHWYTL